MKNKFVLPMVILTGALFVTFALTSASAQTPAGGPFQTIVQKLAQKFGLKESDVQSVFDQARTERVANMQKKLDDRLSQDVKDGKINEAQKQLIIAKLQELKTQRQENQQSLKDWASQNGIDIKYLFGGFGRGFGHFRHPMM
jgi:AraC-like DNA-binding protein